MNYVIFGATSAIAHATARQWAQAGANFCLVGRNGESLQRCCDDLTARGADTATALTADLTNLAAHEALFTSINDRFNSIDVVLIAHGTLPDQAACEESVSRTLTAINDNGLSQIALLTLCANQLAAQGSGTLAVITSVAGDRGRQSNYVYGSAKSMVSTFLSGLRNRLHASKVQVLDIRPGFVDTPMTAHLPKGPLWASADTVAKGIDRAIDKNRNVVYLPGFWWLIMLVIRSVPETLFKRLQL